LGERGGGKDMTPESAEALLDYLAEEKREQTRSLRYASYLPAIRSWKLWRANNTPFGFGEDPSHVCTKTTCKDKGHIRNLVPGSSPPVFGCDISGMIHVCDKTYSVCPYSYTDGDCVYMCVFSGRPLGREVTHSWKKFDPTSVRNKNCGVSLETHTAIAFGGGTDGSRRVLPDGGDTADQDDGWILDLKRMIESAVRDPDDDGRDAGGGPKDGTKLSLTMSAGSRAPVIKRKTHLVPHAAPPAQTDPVVDLPRINTPTARDDYTVVSMTDVMGVAASPMLSEQLSACSALASVPRQAIESLRRTMPPTRNAAVASLLATQKQQQHCQASTPSMLSVGTPIRAASFRDIATPRLDDSVRMFNGGFVFGGEEEEEEEREGGYIAPREREYARLRKRQYKKRELLLETMENLTELKQDTDAILFDLLWDGRTRRAIHAKRTEQARQKAGSAVSEYVKQSHTFHMKIRASSTAVDSKRVPLFPSMFDMDSIYLGVVHAVPQLVVPAFDKERNSYYSAITGKLWRYISYYGEDPKSRSLEASADRCVSFVAFVTGVLYTLKQDGLVVDTQVWIPPDPYLERNLPRSAELDWKPRTNPLVNAHGAARVSAASITAACRAGSNVVGKSRANMMPPSSSGGFRVEDGSKRKVKSLHAHLHGDAGAPGSSQKAHYRRYKRKIVEEPGWMPTGVRSGVSSKRKKRSKRSRLAPLGYGNMGRTYGRSIITSGRNFLKRHMLRFAAPEWSAALRRVLEPEIAQYHALPPV